MLTFSLLAVALLQTPAEAKLATVEGTVMHAASRVPVLKAKVTLTALGPETSSTADAGDNGKFIIKDIKPGRYRLTAQKTGYETTAYGARRTSDVLGQVLYVGPGATITGLDILLPKHGVIAGKVIDSDGEPVNRALVLALANRYYTHGRRAQIPRGAVPVLSNDLGEYRVGQLPPGKYIVCAIPANFYQPTPPSDKELKPSVEDADATTCYPGVPQMGEATQIEIRDGAEVPATDIRLQRTRMVTVQGRLTGIPAGGGTVSLLNLNKKTSGPLGNVLHPRTIVQGSEGRFEFKNVPPGAYVLHTLPTGLGNAPFVVKTEIEVGDRPITDLQVPVSVPIEIKARIEAEPGKELKLPSIRVILSAADEVTSALAMANANADGDLTLANVVPGRQRVTITGVPYTHYVRDISVGDQIAQGDEIDIASPAAPFVIRLSAGNADISGIAKNDKAEPVPGAYVALIPKPQRAFRIRIGRTDQNGVFRFGNIAPGDYRLAAFDTVEPGSLEDEEFLKPYEAKLKTVTVEEVSSQTFEITILPGKQEQ